MSVVARILAAAATLAQGPLGCVPHFSMVAISGQDPGSRLQTEFVKQSATPTSPTASLARTRQHRQLLSFAHDDYDRAVSLRTARGRAWRSQSGRPMPPPPPPPLYRQPGRHHRQSPAPPSSALSDALSDAWQGEAGRRVSHRPTPVPCQPNCLAHLQPATLPSRVMTAAARQRPGQGRAGQERARHEEHGPEGARGAAAAQLLMIDAARRRPLPSTPLDAARCLAMPIDAACHGSTPLAAVAAVVAAAVAAVLGAALNAKPCKASRLSLPHGCRCRQVKPRRRVPPHSRRSLPHDATAGAPQVPANAAPSQAKSSQATRRRALPLVAAPASVAALRRHGSPPLPLANARAD